MRKKKPFLLFFLFLISQSLFSQTETYTTSPVVRVYADIFSGLNQGNNASAIEIQRAYVGYNVNFSDGFTSQIVLDIGSPDNTSAYSLLKRYAYFKTAYLQYETGKFKFRFGIIPMQLFGIQESVWGHRYVEKSAADKYKFGASSDLGLSANYKLNSKVELDLTLSNGEGNAELQHDNTYKLAGGITLKPYKGFILRTYADVIEKEYTQVTWVGFIGYEQKNKYAVGLEYDQQYNVKNNADENLYIFSVTSSYWIKPKLQLFARYDILRSNILVNETQPWNIAYDGSALIGGIQYSPIPKINLALNYQDWVPYAANIENKSFIYLNLEFRL